jgi:ABC-type transport system involved in multi-copper enzyme maturation permease subunit
VSRPARIGIVMRMTFFEAMRRKDMYGILTLAFILIACIGCTRFYGVEGFDAFFRDMSLAITNLTLVVTVVVITARQFLLDLESRMIQPVLCRGVNRFDYVLGKFAGCFVVAVFALCVLHIQLLLALGIFGVDPGLSLPRVLALRAMTIAAVLGMTFFFSHFLRFGVNVAVSVLVCGVMSVGSWGIGFASARFDRLGERATALLSVTGPHVAVFDITARGGVLDSTVPGSGFLVLALHSLLYVSLFVAGSHYLLHRRKL